MFEIQWETIVTNINWTFVINLVQFFLLVLILNHIIYKPLLQFMANRQARLKGQLEDAEQQRAAAEALRSQQASELREANLQSRKTLEAARQEANEVRRNLRAEAENQAQSMIEAARREAEAELKPVRKALLGQVEHLATLAAAQALGQKQR